MSVSRRFIKHEDGSGTVYTVTVHPPALSFMTESETAEVSAQLLTEDLVQIREGYISTADHDKALCDALDAQRIAFEGQAKAVADAAATVASPKPGVMRPSLGPALVPLAAETTTGSEASSTTIAAAPEGGSQ